MEGEEGVQGEVKEEFNSKTTLLIVLLIMSFSLTRSLPCMSFSSSFEMDIEDSVYTFFGFVLELVYCSFIYLFDYLDELFSMIGLLVMASLVELG